MTRKSPGVHIKAVRCIRDTAFYLSIVLSSASQIYQAQDQPHELTRLVTPRIGIAAHFLAVLVRVRSVQPCHPRHDVAHGVLLAIVLLHEYSAVS